MKCKTCRNALLLFCSVLLQPIAGQVSMRTNLLHTIPLRKSVIFEVRLNKGDLTNFSKLQIEVPEGITIREVESRDGSFTFEDNKAKLIWVATPADSVISVRMKLAALQDAVDGKLIFKYYYMLEDDK